MSTSVLWAEALRERRTEPAAAPTPAAARALKKSLRLRGRANSATLGTFIVCFSISYLSPHLTRDPEGLHGGLHVFQGQGLLERNLVRRADQVQNVDRGPMLALGVVYRDRRRQNVLALQRGRRALVRPDAYRLESSRKLQERHHVGEHTVGVGELGHRGNLGTELAQRRRDRVRMGELVVADYRHLVEERAL